MIERKKHVDGVWYTSEHIYQERKIFIKAQRGNGIKAHVFLPNSNKVEFTLRYNFIEPKQLLKKVKDKIDKNGDSRRF